MTKSILVVKGGKTSPMKSHILLNRKRERN